jgi:hypothetical protein
MRVALPIVGLFFLVLAYLSLFISRRLGDRVQSALVLVLGLLGLVLFGGSLTIYGSSGNDWVGVATSAGAAGLGAFFLVRERRG